MLLGWGPNCQTGKSTFNIIFSVQSLSQYHFLHGAWSKTPGDDYIPCHLRDCHGETGALRRINFYIKVNKIIALKQIILLIGNS